MVLARLFSRSLWWAQVTVTPEARSTAVFSSGTLNGLSGWIPAGGQQHPSSGVGDNLLWKKAQKKAKKNSTSDVINKIIPHRRPVVTYDSVMSYKCSFTDYVTSSLNYRNNDDNEWCY